MFLVAGMHRSGTSYLTHALSFLGLGLPESLSPPADDNAKGHFESRRVTQVLDEMLGEFAMSWESLLPLPDAWGVSEVFTTYKDVLTNILKEEYSKSKPILLKDPRLSLCLPLMAEVAKDLGAELSIILPFRHPIEVARSLKVRNNFSEAKSLLIWLNYILTSEASSRSLSRTFLHFPYWIENYEENLKRIATDLGTHFPAEGEQYYEMGKQQFEYGLLHSSSQEELKTSSSLLHSLCLRAFDALKLLADDPQSTEAMVTLDELAQDSYAIAQLSVGLMDEESDRTRQECREHYSNLDKNQELKEALSRIEQLTTTLYNVRDDYQDLSNRFEISEEIRKRSEHTISSLEAQLAYSIEQFELFSREEGDGPNHSKINDLRLELKQESYEEALAQIDQLNETIGNLRRDYEDLSVRFEASEKVRASIEEATQLMDGQLKAAIEQVNHADELLKASNLMRQENERLHEASRENAQRLDDLTTEIESSREKLAQTQSELTSKEEVITHQQSQLENIQSELQLTLQRRNILEQELGHSADRENELANQVAERSSLEAQLRVSTDEYEDAIRRYRHERMTVIKPVYRNL